ncbi:MAG: glycosyltransferase family 39 protein [Planctomycetota bacterium]
MDPIEALHGVRRPVRWSLVGAGVVAVSVVLATLPGRTQIPPLIESDYCYLLTAADRLYEGHGLTTPQPVAPLQPWSWQYDWGFLTNWPVGYPLLIWATRVVFNLTSIQACRWISVATCALALVGWFTWIKRALPPGVTGVLLSAVAAASAVPVSSLTNPSTDAVLVAAVPFVLLLATGARRSSRWTALAGLTAGGLFWIRYASVFVPVAVGLYLLVEAFRRRVRLRDVGLFGVSSALPIAAILIINRLWGAAASTRAQLNLGPSAAFDFSVNLLARAWWTFTDLGFYDYRPPSHWVYALWPVGLAVCAACFRQVRATMRSFLGTPALSLSTWVVIALLGMLVGATTFFRAKFDYVGLERYYLPIRPLYFLLFVGPVMLIPRRVVRAGACVALFAAGSWTVQQEWSGAYARQLRAEHAVTPYGTRSQCFEPGASQLYEWLRQLDGASLIVVSNFHEFIALETKIPTLPIPPDPATLNQWVERIGASRGVGEARVLFVLDSDNKWRDYWIASPTGIVHSFKLQPHAGAPSIIAAYLYDYRARTSYAAVP